MLEKGFSFSFLWELDIQTKRIEIFISKRIQSGCKKNSFMNNSAAQCGCEFDLIFYWLTMLVGILRIFKLHDIKYEIFKDLIRNSINSLIVFNLFTTDLKQMQLSQSQDWCAGWRVGNVASRSSDIEMRVLQRLRRSGIVLIQARRHDQEGSRSLMATRSS